MNRRVRVMAVVGLAMLVAALLLSGCAKPKPVEKITFKATTIQMPNQSLAMVLEDIKKGIEAKFPGRIEMLTYPSAQLYTQNEEVEALQRNEIQMACVVGTGTLPLISSNYNVVELPGMFPTRDLFYKVLNGPVGQELWKQFEAKDIHLASYYASGSIAISDKKKVEIRQPGDVKGMKIRPSGKTYAVLLEKWGAQSVSVASEEQYSALQQGVMDGIMTACTIYSDRKLYEVVTNMTDLGPAFISRATGLIVNNTWWNNLPKDIRDALQQIVTDTTKKYSDLTDSLDKAAYDASVKAGVKLYTPTADEMKVWNSTAKETWSQLISSLKIDQAWVDKMTKAVSDAAAAK